MINKRYLLALAALAATTNAQALTVSFEPVSFTDSSFGGGNTVSSAPASAAGFDDFFTSNFQLLGAQAADTTVSGPGSSTPAGTSVLVSNESVQFSQGLIDQNRAEISYGYSFRGLASGGDDEFEVFLTPDIPAQTSEILTIGTPATLETVVEQPFDISGLESTASYELVLRLKESESASSNVAAGLADFKLTAIPEPNTTLVSIVGPTLILGLWLMGRHRRQLGHADTRG